MFAYRRQNERHILNNKIHTAFRGSYGGTRNTMSSYSCATVHSAQCTLIMNCIYLSVQLNIRVVIKRIVDRAVYTFQSIATLPHLPHDELKVRRSVASIKRLLAPIRGWRTVSAPWMRMVSDISASTVPTWTKPNFRIIHMYFSIINSTMAIALYSHSHTSIQWLLILFTFSVSFEKCLERKYMRTV